MDSSVGFGIVVLVAAAAAAVDPGMMIADIRNRTWMAAAGSTPNLKTLVAVCIHSLRHTFLLTQAEFRRQVD